jgi:hypothetical protein
MLSLVAGAKCGVAKNASPILVRMPCRKGEQGQPLAFQPADWIDGLSMINDELDGSYPSVVSMSVFWRKDYFISPDGELHENGFLIRHLELLESLAAKGAILVTGTGNEGYPKVEGIPAKFAKTSIDTFHVPSLLVMGGVSPDGRYMMGNFEDAAGLPHAYGPGLRVRSVDADESFWNHNDGYYYARGTSCATALTAGLAAYTIRLSQLGLLDVKTDPQSIKDFIISQTWSRRDIFDQPRPGIWNGFEGHVTPGVPEWTPKAAAPFRREFQA